MKILASFLIIIFSYNFVFPHSCLTYKNSDDSVHTQKLNQTDAIFSGEVIFVNEISLSVYSVELKVLQIWKGVEKNKVTIKYSNPCTNNNQFPFEIGSKIMIYGYTIKDSEWIDVNCCNLNLFDDESMKKVYGEGKIFEELNSSQTESIESFWDYVWRKIKSFFS